MISTNELDEQLQRTRSLLGSADWIIWADFLKKERRHKLQEKINEAVRKGDLNEAQQYLILFDDCLKQIELFKTHISGLEKLSKEKKENGE